MLRFAAIGAVVVMSCALMAPAWADGVPAGAGEKVAPAAPGCRCPTVHHWRHARFHARHHRWAAPLPPPLATALDYYNPLLPSPFDSIYDRTMTDHFRTPVVTDIYHPERPLPRVTAGILYYRVRAGDGVLQYDGLTGHYVPLARNDAQLIAAAALTPAPAPSPK